MDKRNSSWLKTFSIGFSIISFGITIAIVGYFILTTKQNRDQQPTTTSPTPVLDDLQTPSPTESIPLKTLIKLTTPGKYTDEKYGYTIEFPEDWDLYRNTSGLLRLHHPKCKGEDLVLPEKTAPCTGITLPYYEGGIGYGYGNKRQTEEIVTLTNNVTAKKEIFYYDTHILISWKINVDIPKEEKELGISPLIAFASVNEDFTPGSLETVNTIIKSLNFKN